MEIEGRYDELYESVHRVVDRKLRPSFNSLNTYVCQEQLLFVYGFGVLMHMLQVVEDVMSYENAPKIFIAAIVRTKLNVKEALHYTHTHSLLVLAFLHA